MTYIKPKPYTKHAKLALEFFNKQKPASLVLLELSLMKGEVSFRSFDYLKWKDCNIKSNLATLRFSQSPYGKLIKFCPTEEEEQDIALIFVDHHKDENVTFFFLPSHQTYVLMNSKEAFFYLKKVIE